MGQRKIKDAPNAKNKVWTLEGNTVVAHSVGIGITDGTHTQILGGIRQGQRVITGVSVKSAGDEASADGGQASESSPFAPGRPGGNKKK